VHGAQWHGRCSLFRARVIRTYAGLDQPRGIITATGQRESALRLAAETEVRRARVSPRSLRDDTTFYYLRELSAVRAN